MLLKAGTYRFNDVLSDFPIVNLPANSNYNQSISFIYVNERYELIEYGRVVGEAYNTDAEMVSFYKTDTIGNDYISIYEKGLINGTTVNGYVVNTPVEMTILTDTEVDDTFGTWYISNTNYNEVNAPVEDTIYTEKSSWYKSVADAIRNKKGTSEPINRDDFASEISSISVGEEVPYYDGTVIIEKANSVLGLRRFKESVTPIEDVTFEQLTSQEQSEYLYQQYGFEISTITLDTSATISGMTCVVNLTNYADYGLSNGLFIIGKVETTDGTILYSMMSFDEFTTDYPTFTVTSTANSTVDEWLLANTEGVSV